MNPLLIPLILVALAGLALFWQFQRAQRAARNAAQERDALRQKAEYDLLQARGEAARELQQARAEADQQQTRIEERAGADIRVLEERLAAQTQERAKLEEQFREQFRNLANDILEEKSRRFTEVNQKNIGDLLKPLGENITKFQEQIGKEFTQRELLKAEIEKLHEMSNQVSQQANNLASALRGNSKVQGDWGEMILETLLENSGLQRGLHFKVQENFKNDEGANLRPDVVLSLPDGKQMVIDSKVSLTAYAAYAEAEDEQQRKQHLAAHIASVRRHVAELGDKAYQKQVAGSPDFVLLFIPTEPAFLLALQNDDQIWHDAYRKNVVLTSTTTLMAVLRIVEDHWKRDSQSRRALEIAKQGGTLYDKFIGFAENFAAIGEALGRTEKVYQSALGQLRDGRGNLVRQAEKLRDLGTKRLPKSLEPMDDEQDEAPGLLESSETFGAPGLGKPSGLSETAETAEPVEA